MRKIPKTPVLFVSHGSPMVALENDGYTVALERWGKSLPKPKAVVAVSAHWEAGAPVRVTTGAAPRVIYDFGGFPDELYRLAYPSPGEPALAKTILTHLTAAGIPAVADPLRGIDHGVWVPLRRIFPEADVPVVQVTLPLPRKPEELIKIGQALVPLREQGVLLFGTGGIVHNLGLVHFYDKFSAIDSWAKRFDGWVASRLESGDTQALIDYRSAAVDSNLAVPTTEHFDPLFFALGAAPGEKIDMLHEGFHYGNLSMRSFTLSSR